MKREIKDELHTQMELITTVIKNCWQIGQLSLYCKLMILIHG